MKEGVFWVIPQESNNYKILTVFDGTSGHSDIWKTVAKEKKQLAKFEYDFFPRGRVWIKDGKATIFLNPTINIPVVVTQIIGIFELTESEYVICEDI